MQPTETPATAPAPPPGPGVYPPFPAPPVEGRGSRIGWGLGIGAAVLLLVCGGGVAALFGLGKVAGDALGEQGRVAATRYFTALRDGRLTDAYGMLCASARSVESRDAWVARQRRAPAVASFEVGEVGLGFDGSGVPSAPVDLRYVGGSTDRRTVIFDADQGNGGLRVCRVV